ncbi:PHB depolymerase family esterase [Piscinibacter sp. HJYY11]|uniref:extracellular catalytic domain type 1 short-chain-length polyhydroxyalkanoate depolymerase n=1 Tax=Piscinibacter sp. HJYY11 TaxID=2801333 RepID=UPI00191F892E|nr:PHB depolymerase family esterase [Piscinibacter sp. HJYY11]MBL0727264.1 PHB depolymerase family esterase [Piscinibacter sp. HJYY11]
MDSTFISDTINRALTTAGLGPGYRAQGIDIHRVIEDALASAGLAHAPSAPPRTALDDVRDAPRRAPAAPGRFVWHRHTGPHGSRDYRLYVPASCTDACRPALVMMLHGCKQHPDDFAAGTRMNELAERHGFLVAYPAQTRRANGSNCWNWFDTAQQQRSGGEPSILAGIVDDINAMYPVDRSKVYVAGLSAGAAMAVILGQTHPDLFAGIGAHSGLPKGVAHDVPSAFAAMQSRTQQGSGSGGRAVRTMVIHGDADATVNVANGSAIIRHALDAYKQSGVHLQPQAVQTLERGGRRYSSRAFCDELGMPLVEECVIHGGGHAWSGGDTAGSFTDRSGPDASEEFVRFFLGSSGARPITRSD